MEKIKKNILVYYALSMGAIFPLIVHDGFFDITVTKYRWFVISTICLIAAYGTFKYSGMKEERKTSFTFCFLWYVIFVVSGLISALCSEHIKESLLGTASRYNGWFTFFLIGIVIYIFMNEGKLKYWCVDALEITAFLVMALGIVNFLHIDPFGFFKHMQREQIDSFVSTIGNLDVFGEYIATVWVIVATRYCFEYDNRIRQVCRALFLGVGVIALLLNGTDGILLAWLFFVVFIPFTMNGIKNVLRYLELWMIILGASALCVMLPWENISHRPFDGMLNVLVGQSRILINLFFVSVLFYMVVYGMGIAVNRTMILPRRKVKLSDIVKSLKILYGVGILLLFVCLMGIIIWINRAPEQFHDNPLLMKLYISDAWGSSRGYIWKETWRAYSECSIREKLLGTGPGTMQYLWQERIVQTNHLGKVIDSVHNFYLQLLVCHGIVGLAAYVVWLFSLVLYGIRVKSKEKINVALLFGIMAYYAQALVGINAIHMSGWIAVLTGMYFCDYNIVNVDSPSKK